MPFGSGFVVKSSGSALASGASLLVPPLRTAVRRRFALALCLAVSLLAAATAGPPPAQTAVEDGALPPQDGWVIEGGSASRTASGRSRALVGPVESGWTATVAGPICGEPLVTGSRIVLDVAAPAGQHTISVHDLWSGRQLAKRSVRTTAPLLPAIVGGFVVVRTAPTKVGAYRIRATELIELWNQDVGGEVASFVALDGAVFVRAGDRVSRWEIGAREPTWSTSGSRARGRLAARGGHVYCVDYDPRGNARLVALERRSGLPSGRVEIGHHDGQVPDGAEDPLVFVDESFALVVHRLGVATQSGRPANLSSVKRVVSSDGAVFLSDAGLQHAEDVPLCLGRTWLGRLEGEKGPQLFHGNPDSDEGRVFASATRHPEWLDGMTRASSAGGVLFHPQGALDLASLRILWTPEQPWTSRPVPVRGGLLVVEGGTTLRALRQKGGEGAAAAVDVGAGPPKEAAPGRAVLRDGSILAGPMRRADDGSVVVDGRPPRPIPKEDLLLLEDQSGRILRAVPGDDLAPALDAISGDLVGTAVGKLLTDTLATRDATLLRRLLGEAVLRGAPPADVEKAEKRIRDLTRPGKPLPADDAATTAAEQRLAAAAAIPAATVTERLKSLPADAPPEVVSAVIRAILRIDPKSPEAAARVRAMLPAGMTPGEPFDARDWLEFAEVVRTTPVTVVKPVPSNHPGITPAQRTVSLLAMQWRQDVVGLQSRQLLIVTSVRRPGAISRCLALGELVCSTLEKLFEKGTRRRSTREPLTLVLYPDEKEFAKESEKGGHGDMSWSAGFYSPREELSRLYLPENDEEFEQAIGTFAHELTHQWIDERCPTFGNVDAKAGSRTPGYWIVEGFATLVEELRFEPRRGTWTFDPWNSTLEVVAVADPARLHPWDQLLGWTHADFAKLSRKTQLEAPFVRRLGFHRAVTGGRLFYDQAAAVCGYLFEAEGGVHREKLLDYLSARYRGEPPPIEAAFGMSAAELGKRVQAWAREKSSGAR